MPDVLTTGFNVFQTLDSIGQTAPFTRCFFAFEKP